MFNDNNNLLNDEFSQANTRLYEYIHPKKTSILFTFHRHKDQNGKFIDDGVCPVCGKRGTYLFVDPQKKIPLMCYSCYQATRAYKGSLNDPLKLRRKKTLTTDDCTKVVKYMQKVAKAKQLSYTVLLTYLISNVWGKKE